MMADSSDHGNHQRRRVLILDGGFAGIGAARKLKDADVDVVLVDRNDFHTFQPLLYQVATDLLDLSAVGHPLRDLFHDQPNVAVHQATVTGIDPDAREVQFEEMTPIGYDHLVLGLGAQVNFFGVKGAAEHAFPLYTLADAARLKEHILRKWEAADRDPALIADGALNIVIVGGGPTGVESAGALAELYHSNFADDYRGIPQDAAHLTLVEAGPVLFSMFKPDIRTYTQKALAKRDVDPLLGSLGIDLQKGNRIGVGPDLRVPEHPEIFAVGDAAWITDAETGEVLPQLGSVALQAGEQSGENIARLLAGRQ